MAQLATVDHTVGRPTHECRCPNCRRLLIRVTSGVGVAEGYCRHCHQHFNFRLTASGVTANTYGAEATFES